MLERENLPDRINTLPLRRGDMPTRALVVRNPNRAPVDSPVRVRYRATFPIRAAVGPQPVTVWNAAGEVVPSRQTLSETRAEANLPPDRVWWTLELELVVDAVPAQGWTTLGAAFGSSPASRSDDEPFWETLPLLPLPITETDCHEGDLPLIGSAVNP
jgi:hypothetical protein